LTVAIVADAHLCGPGGPPDHFVEQIQALPETGCRHLVLLGDIFQAWVGLPRFETPQIRELLGALEVLRSRGLKVSYVEGNRDFFLDEGRYARALDEVAREVAFEVAGVRYLAVHGDGIDDRDLPYRFWRWASKSMPSRVLMRRLPARWAQRLVTSTERRLATVGFKHKTRIPRQAIERYATGRLAEGHDVLVLGHFHEPARWAVGGGEVWLIDAWFRSQRLEILGESAARSASERASQGVSP
jgi:UDP-2,3-diacylglucosamine hydrolase